MVQQCRNSCCRWSTTVPVFVVLLRYSSAEFFLCFEFSKLFVSKTRKWFMMIDLVSLGGFEIREKNRTSRAFRTPVVILITILLNLKIIIIKNLPWSWTLLSYLRFRMVWSWNIEASLRPDHGTNVRSNLIIIDFDLKINSQLFRKTGHKSRTLFWQVYRSMSSNFSGKTRRVGKMKKTSNLNSVRKMRERERG